MPPLNWIYTVVPLLTSKSALQATVGVQEFPPNYKKSSSVIFSSLSISHSTKGNNLKWCSLLRFLEHYLTLSELLMCKSKRIVHLCFLQFTGFKRIKTSFSWYKNHLHFYFTLAKITSILQIFESLRNPCITGSLMRKPPRDSVYCQMCVCMYLIIS